LDKSELPADQAQRLDKIMNQAKEMKLNLKD